MIAGDFGLQIDVRLAAICPRGLCHGLVVIEPYPPFFYDPGSSAGITSSTSCPDVIDPTRVIRRTDVGKTTDLYEVHIDKIRFLNVALDLLPQRLPLFL